MYFWSRIPFLPNGVNTFHAESDVIQNYQNIFTIALKPWNWFHSKTEKFVCPSGINQFQVLICLQKCKNTGFHTSGCSLNVTVQIWHQPNINFTFTFSRWQNFTWAINGREGRGRQIPLHWATYFKYAASRCFLSLHKWSFTVSKVFSRTIVPIQNKRNNFPRK